jgi:hypothetical protein
MPTFNAILTEVVRGRPFVEDPFVGARVALISNLFMAGLYFFIAFLLASWLYASPLQMTLRSCTPTLNDPRFPRHGAQLA